MECDFYLFVYQILIILKVLYGIEIGVGARFIILVLVQMLRMPGLPSNHASEGMNINDYGLISILS